MHSLTDKIKGKRLVKRKGLLKRHDAHGANNIPFSDETLVEEASNAQIDRTISANAHAIP